MKCPNCGTEQPTKTKFCRKCGLRLDGTTCPRCGNPVLSGVRYCGVCGTPLNPKRKGWKIALIVVLCLALAVGGVVGAWQLIWSEDAQLVKAAENYAEVNEALLAVTTADGYDDLTTAEKAEQVLSALDDLADEGKVLADSVGYDKSYPLVYYSYADGAYGGVMLEGFASDTFGIGGESYDTNIYKDEERGWIFDPWPAVPTFGTDGSPYESDLSALVVCDMGNSYEKYLELAQSLQSGWNEAYLDTTLVEDGTLSFFRTGLSGYDLIVIWEHGEVYPGTDGEQPVIILQEVAGLVDDSNTAHSSGSLSDWQDMHENRIGQVTDGTYYMYFLMPSFFSYYYGDGQLADSIIWVGGCYGYYNDALVSVLADCGAKSVLGASNSVVGSYDFLMLDAFAYMQLCGKTVEESLTFAEQIWGANDWIFAANRNLPNAEEAAGAEIHWYNGGDETLVTLTAEAQEIAQQGICSGAVIDAADSSVPIVGATITVTDADGTVAETTTDETGAFEIELYPGTYTVQIEKEGYESQTEEVTIAAGEDSTLLVSLSAEITMSPPVNVEELLSDESARAAYQQFLDNGEYSNRVGEVSGIQYAIYDVTGDGISELLLHCYSTGVDGTYYVYGYDGAVYFIGSCVNVYREGAYYSAEKNNLVIVANGDSDWISYEFYDVTDQYALNGQLTLTYEMGRIFYEPGTEPDTDDVLDGHFYIADGEGMRDVTESEWNSHIDELTEIVFSDLTDATTFAGNDLTDTDSKSSTEASDTSDVSDIVFDIEYTEDYYYSGSFYAYAANGTLVWSKEVELAGFMEIGLRDGCYYYVNGGTVVAMDAATGEILWENSDFGGYSGSVAFAEDCICLAGIFGPDLSNDFCAVSYDGTTVCEISSFDVDYFWVDGITISDNTATVSLDYGSYEVQINLDTWSYIVFNLG